MRIIENPPKEEWAQLCERTADHAEDLSDTVRAIVERVKRDGDEALRDYNKRFDGNTVAELLTEEAEFEAASEDLSEELKSAIRLARENIAKFHRNQLHDERRVETSPGVMCWRETRAIQKVGLYIPGGSAPLFSTVLMLAVPALIAGCEDIVICTPAGQNGKIAPEILYTADLLGIRKVYKCGGAQAIAAMAYGTDTVPKVYKIFGPGNAFVTKAKQLVQEAGTAIDMPAGPSEVLVVANEDSEPSFVAADLLAQAEHGPDSQVVLCCLSVEFARKVNDEIQTQLASIPRAEVVEKALEGSFTIVFSNLAQALNFSNAYAPEHLILALDGAESALGLIENAGSVFLGPYTCESIGDYASGTNHTLPTSAFARSYSGVSLDSFLKQITFQKVSAKGLQEIGPAVEVMAAAEQLVAHKNAVSLRLDSLKKDLEVEQKQGDGEV